MYKQLFVGLGGQGAKTICEIKKHLYEMELNARAADGASRNRNAYKCFHYGFLSIDSSSNVWDDKKLWMHKGKSLVLTNDEKCQLLAPAPGAVQGQNIAPWLYSKNADKQEDESTICQDLIQSSPQGAGQRRRYGRILFASNVEQVYLSLENALNTLKKTSGDQSDTCVINVFCSLGGGTGSGGIVDLLTLIRERFGNGSAQVATGSVLKKFPINLYLYLSSQTGGHDVGFFLENQYAALRDINSLVTGLFRPHTLCANTDIDTKGYTCGSRVPKNKADFQNPVDAIQIFTNKNDKNVDVSIGEQIKNVAQGAVQRALLTSDPDEDIIKIATGEDSSLSYAGEPNTDAHLLERSFRFGGMGIAKWQTPLNELRQMAVDSILANSFRQMLYNYPTEKQGYLKQPRKLNEELERYSQYLTSREFLLTKEVHTLWDNWSKEPSGVIQTIRSTSWSGDVSSALSRMEQAFNKCFEEISRDEPTDIAKKLTLKQREGALLSHFGDLLQISQDKRAATVRTLFFNYLMALIADDWAKGKIGLHQAEQIVEHVIDTANKTHERLGDLRKQKQPGGTEYDAFERSISFRNNAKDGQWQKLTAVSFKIKGQKLLDAHAMDLVNKYTVLTQCSHIDKMREQLKFLVSDLESFVKNLQDAIGVMERYEKERMDEYKSLPLYSFILKGGKPKESQKLIYDCNLGDTKLKELLQAIDTNNTGQGETIEVNADAIRAVVAKSKPSKDSALNLLFKGTKVMDDETSGAIMQVAYERANAMLSELDERLATRMLGGIVERVKNMESTEFDSKLERLLKAATLSYEHSNNATLNGYGLATKAKMRYIVSFPDSLDLSHLSDTIDIGDGSVEARKTALLMKIRQKIGGTLPPDALKVEFQNRDNTQISVWQTEYVVPARSAAVIGSLRSAYLRKMANGNVNDTFWLDIDEQAQEMGADLSYPSSDDLSMIRKASFWMVENCPEFTSEPLQNGSYKVTYVKNGINQVLYNGNNNIVAEDVLKFYAELVKTLSKRAESNHALVIAMKEAYDSYEIDKRTAMAGMYDKYIKPMLFRIAMKHNISGLFDLD